MRYIRHTTTTSNMHMAELATQAILGQIDFGPLPAECCGKRQG